MTVFPCSPSLEKNPKNLQKSDHKQSGGKDISNPGIQALFWGWNRNGPHQHGFAEEVAGFLNPSI